MLDVAFIDFVPAGGSGAALHGGGRRCMHQSTYVWQEYAQERDAVRARVGAQLRRDMAKLVGQQDHADVVLIASDGARLPAHTAIVKQRAPGFYRRYVQPALAKTPKGAQVLRRLTDRPTERPIDYACRCN